MRQQFVDAAGRLSRQPLEDVAQVGVGICPLSRAEWTRLMMAAARLPARRLPANSQLVRPLAIGRIWFSTQLLSIGRSPSSM